MQPSRGRQFVYSTTRKGTGQQSTSASASRKRKWSPGTTAVDDNARAAAGSTSYGAHGTAAKIKRTDDFEDDEDFDMDELGTAALDQYVLSQQMPKAGTEQNPHIGHKLLDSNIQEPNSGGGQKWANPYKKDPSNTASIPDTSKASHQGPLKHTTSVPPEQALKKLQEENYAKDGEVKVLRNEKERLAGELRKREEQMYEIKTRLVSEKKEVETQMSKEKDSLTAQLQFLNQELASLCEKCLLLEQRNKSPNLNRPISMAKLDTNRPISMAKLAKTSCPEKTSTPDFLSTESFMPLSQMGHAEITPVHIKQKRGSRERSVSISEKRSTADSKPKKSRVSRSPTTTPSEAGTDPSLRKKTSKSKESSSPATKVSCRPTVDPSMILNVPSKDLDNTQLLMLLIRRDLLKPPEFVTPDGAECEEEPPPVVPDKDSQSSDEDSPQSSSDEQQNSLTGLLSLLRVQPKAGPPQMEYLTSLSTPVKSMDASLKDSSLLPTMESSVPVSTPVRQNKRLQLSKTHVLARTDVVKSRLEKGSSMGMKSISACNSPLHIAHDKKSSSLLHSVDKNGLEQSIGALLQSADISSISRCSSTVSANSFCPNLLFSRMPENSNLDLLKRIATIVLQYHTEQSHKAKGSGNTSISEFGDSLDSSSNLTSPKSLSSTGTISSKTSSDTFCPLKCDQDLASQALDILETLVSYSQSVRDQILLQAPKFSIDSRPGSSLDMHPPHSLGASLEGTSVRERYDQSITWSKNSSDLAEVSRRLSFLRAEEGGASVQNTPVHQSHLFPQQDKEWRGQQLSNLCHPLSNLSNKVWVNKECAPQSRKQQELSFSLPSISSRTSGCNGLFNALLEMPAPSWRESTHNIVTCLKILTSLADDCSIDTLPRFSPLLEDDAIGVCLDKDDPSIVLSTLSLLRQLVKSSVIVSLLCHNQYCVPSSCYDICLQTLPTGCNRQSGCDVRVQIVRLLSNILVIENGPSILLTSPCQCTHELLKTLVLLLSNLVDNVHETSHWTHQEFILVRELISLMHKISIHDNFFDTHRLECEHTYMFVLNSLSWLLKTHHTPLKEVTLVSELLEYCEEMDDSEEQDKMDTTN